MFYLMMDSTPLIYGYMASDIWSVVRVFAHGAMGLQIDPL